MSIRRKYLLDTDTCSYILKRKPVSVLEIFERINTDNIQMSVITYSELLYGAEKTKSQRINTKVIESFCEIIEVVEWDKDAARQYAIIREYLESKGEMIGNMDVMIAAHACSLNLTLVTNNQKHFSKVLNLSLENWVFQTTQSAPYT